MSTPLNRLHTILRTGEPQEYNNLTVIPLLDTSGAFLDCLGLSAALQREAFQITEMDEYGSVPEIKVVNRLDTEVLLVDGEELAGAKQNRVLNTTVLVAAQTETVLPVSCTEQGRWAEETEQFTDSGIMMPSSIREKKSASVSRSLHTGGRRDSDQGAVWNAVDRLAETADVESSTGAMRDVYTDKQSQLADYIEACTPCDGQVGLIAAINGHIVGMDYVANPTIYRALSEKLVGSYAMDALLNQGKTGMEQPTESAQTLLEEIEACEGQPYPGVGLGEEYRYERPGLTGAALVYKDRVVHTSFHCRSFPLPFGRSYWVVPGQLLAGYYPGGPTKQEAEQKLRALLDAGIRTVVNLTAEDEIGRYNKPLRSYTDLLTQLAAERGVEVTCVRIPIVDMNVPSAATMQSILDTIDTAIERGRPVYAHCWGGRGRTGTVVGCYLARHGIAVGQDALAQIEVLRRHEAKAHHESPQTDDQRDMVRAWQPGQ